MKACWMGTVTWGFQSHVICGLHVQSVAPGFLLQPGHSNTRTTGCLLHNECSNPKLKNRVARSSYKINHSKILELKSRAWEPSFFPLHLFTLFHSALIHSFIYFHFAISVIHYWLHIKCRALIVRVAKIDKHTALPLRTAQSSRKTAL